jgi:DNA helicase-2/ATP-dependent DNA helicase PcrA
MNPCSTLAAASVPSIYRSGASIMDDSLRPRVAAQRLLRWWAASSPGAVATPDAVATPVEAIVEWLGLEVAPFHPEARRSGTLGWLEPGEDLIFLRDDLSEPVRRFTLAHELGHAMLHRAGGPPEPVAEALDDMGLGPGSGPESGDADGGPADPCDDEDLDAPLDALGLGDEALRPGQAYSARARREHEANAFAAVLLLPPATLRALYLGDGSTPGLPPRALAERFGVSEDAVHRALGTLLVPGAADLPDDIVAEAAPATGRLGASSARPALDDWQRAAAAAATPALVVAGPGTGKTSTLVGRVAYLVFERGVDPARILALTFSNKAAQEMRERLAALLAVPASETVEREASAAQRQPVVSTIHAFCGDLLRRYAPLVGLRPDFRLISEAEGYLLLREVAGDLTMPHYQPLAAPAMHFPTLLGAISRAKDELADPARYADLAMRLAAAAQTPDERAAAARALEVARIYAAYQDALAAAGDADFGDLIRLAVRLLREQPDALAELRRRHTHILVDEFQDINRAMGVLLQVLAGPDGPLWAVGDADQAIYRFRGASPVNLARFTEAYPAARVYPLGTNYRSRPPILRAAASVAGALLGEDPREPLEAGRPYDPARMGRAGTGDGEPSIQQGGAQGERADATITLVAAPDEAAELAGLATAIRACVARGYALSDQAVLCRTRRQSQRVAAALAAAGLPARIVTPLLEQPDVKDTLSVLLLLADGSGAGLLRAGAVADHPFSREEARTVLLEARARQTSPIALLLNHDALSTVEGLTPPGCSGLSRLGEVLRELWAAPDVLTGLGRYVFALTGLARRALADPSPAGRTRAANLARLLELGQVFEGRRRDRERGERWRATGRAGWDEFLDYVRVLAALGRDPAGNAGDLLAVATEGVRVLTVHASKGLEFPVVYLPGLASGRFPTQRRGDPAPPPPGLSDDAALEARNPSAHLAEEACLFYVALTRARDELVISRAERYGRRRYQPSPFLKPLMALAEDPDASVVTVRWPAAPEPPAPPAPAGTSFDGDDDLAGEDATPDTSASPREPTVPPGEALRPSAIETYQRCPRQYAYRHVYHLHPREVGLATLRRSLHETLRDLQERIAASNGAQATRGESNETAPPTLGEALALFEQRWRVAVGADPAETPAGATSGGPAEDQDDVAADGPFGAFYRRHGRQVVERAWQDLVHARGLQQPLGADVAHAAVGGPVQSGPARDASMADARPESVAPADRPRPAPLPLAARLEQPALVRVGGRTIEVLLDRVEGDERAGADRLPAGGRAPRAADAAPADGVAGDALAMPAPAPVRFVRHRLGRGGTGAPPDLRALLYLLAAEQERRGAPPELFQHNLTTGELERVQLDAKRLARLRDELAKALAGMESGQYPARPDPAICSTCPFLLICPA